MSRIRSLAGRLYRGEVAYGFVQQRRRWYAISALLLLVTALSLGIRGLDFGVEFTGGTVVTFQAPDATTSQVRQTAESAVDVGQVVVQEVADGRWRLQTERLQPQEINGLQSALAERFGLQVEAISPQVVGPSWGEQISRQAGIGLAVFLALAVVYLSVALEWKMATAAIVALVHDLAVTAGVYALVGFEVTPGTVVGMLTILGYSLYDTVVVFDKVRENTAGLLGGSRMTYSQAANRAVNQVLMRSINTSVIVLLPVGAILFVGAGLLGAGTLKDLALVLFVGIIAGAYSSIFIATPLLTEFKEREPQMQALARRVAARQAGGKGVPGTPATEVQQRPAPAAEGDGEHDGTGEESATPAGVGATSARVVQEGVRQQPRRSGSKKRPSGKSGKKKR